MSVRPIVQVGHTALRTPAKALFPEEVTSVPIKNLVADLVATLKADQGGIGLAAPQIGRGVQVFIACVPPGSPNLPEVPLTTFINPTLKPIGDKKIKMWEGCLSIRGFFGIVQRWESVEVSFLNEKGEAKIATATGVISGLLQHEYDHLKGVMFPQRMRNTKRVVSDEEYARLSKDAKYTAEQGLTVTGTWALKDGSSSGGAALAAKV